MVKVLEVFPYLSVRDTAAAIDFYKQAFGAEEIYRLTEPTGRVGHAEIKLGSYVIMLADENPAYDFPGPQTLGGTTVAMHIHAENVDELMHRAVEAGATCIRKLTNQFYGERSGKVRDPFGHEWLLGQHIEDVSPEEQQRRYDAMFA
jgi:PhnB protein